MKGRRAGLAAVGIALFGTSVSAFLAWRVFDGIPHVVDGVSWSQISIAPFTIAILKYALVVQEGEGATPEEIVLHDHLLQVTGAVWLITYAIGVDGR